MTTSMLSNHHIPEVAHGFRSLVTPIRFAPEHPEPSPITLPLESTDYNSSLTWTLHVYVTIILSKQEDISYTSVKDLMGTGI